ncbi:MAG TPA: hypothetical protein VGH79_00395 [Gaiellaceae bacterium]
MVRVETKPIWTSSSFLVYAGGLTVLGGAAAGLSYLAGNFGEAATAGWALLFLAIVYAIAHALLMRGRWLSAGILAFVAVILWGVFLYDLFVWFGWNGIKGLHGLTGSLDSWSWSRMLFWILVLVAAAIDRRLFRFPFIRLISAVVFYLFVVDLLTSGSGNWFEVVTLVIGFVYLLIGTAVGKPSAFWLHLVGGALIGYSLLQWFHTSTFDFVVISVFSVVFVLVAYATQRSSWAFYGTLGFFLATIHWVGLSLSPLALLGGGSTGFPPSAHGGLFVVEGASRWSPALAFGLLGFWLMLLGMLGKRKRRRKHTAVAIETPAPTPV